MQATWDGNAHQLQNYDFLVIKSVRNEGVVCDALLSHPGKITPCYNSIQPSGNSCSASGTSQCLLWVFHLTTQREREIREAETYNIWEKKSLFFFFLPFVLRFI